MHPYYYKNAVNALRNTNLYSLCLILSNKQEVWLNGFSMPSRKIINLII